MKKENAITRFIKEPPFHFVKRGEVTKKHAILVRVCAIAAALVLSALIIVILTGKNPFAVYGQFFIGNFGTPRRIWRLLQGIAILLGLALAVTPAFKMKFWNCGAEGQALMGGLVGAIMMYNLGSSMPLPLFLILTFIVCALAGALWAVIPAIFKAKWNTNETLFTLMLNYIAIRLVSFFVMWVSTDGSAVLPPMDSCAMPALFGQSYLFNILLVAVLTAALYIYLKYSKHGYEISVVGESENTARYIGINVKSVIIRTMLVSGAICGIVGFLLVVSTDHTINANTVGGQGFTAIMVSWLAKFNPLYMILTSFLLIFLKNGASQISTAYRIDSSISDIVTAIILFFIIGCEFFIQFKIQFRHREKKGENK
mgnify:FL=1